jgi:hypothetical protein
MPNRRLRYLSVAIAALATVAFLFWAWLRVTEATASDFDRFRRGDIIFQTSSSSQSLAILFASHSLFSHMGIVDFDTQSKPFVLEASATTRATPLRDWVNRGMGRRIAVYRMPNLTEEKSRAVVSAARAYFGRAYDLFFYPAEDELYCSELVKLAFQKGAGVELGTLQRAGSLNLDNFAARKIIETRWQRHPLCRDGKVNDFASCFSLIKQQLLITPQSIANDKTLVMIYNNY